MIFHTVYLASVGEFNIVNDNSSRSITAVHFV